MLYLRFGHSFTWDGGNKVEEINYLQSLIPKICRSVSRRSQHRLSSVRPVRQHLCKFFTFSIPFALDGWHVQRLVTLEL